MREHHKRFCNICDNAFERNNYFFGKLMKAQDFEIEQSYFNKKRWLINRMIHGSGVVCGLDVKQKNENEIMVEPGLAIDCCGREILVCETQCVSLEPEEEECSYEEKVQQNNGNEQYAICLKFKECKTEGYPVFYSACDLKEKCQFNRIRDWFEIKVIPFSKPDRKAFCLNINDCTDKKESLHQCICDWFCECPECYEPPCVVLATVTLDNSHSIQEIDKCSNRKLVYNNLLLYDLISCYHGDLPHVCQINWVHDKNYSWDDFRDNVVPNGLIVTFNKPMNRDTVNKHTFQVAAITVEENTGYRLFRYIPADDITMNNEATEFTFIFVQDPGGDEEGESEHPGSVSGLAERAEIEIILRGSSIFSEDGKALDGSFRGNIPDSEEGDLPSGTGTQGSDFVSWFSVEPRDE